MDSRPTLPVEPAGLLALLWKSLTAHPLPPKQRALRTLQAQDSLGRPAYLASAAFQIRHKPPAFPGGSHTIAALPSIDATQVREQRESGRSQIGSVTSLSPTIPGHFVHRQTHANGSCWIHTDTATRTSYPGPFIPGLSIGQKGWAPSRSVRSLFVSSI